MRLLDERQHLSMDASSMLSRLTSKGLILSLEKLNKDPVGLSNLRLAPRLKS